MSESDRGAYTPPTADAPLAFDARQPVRGSRPVPMTLIVSGVVLLILVATIIFFYRSGVRQEGQAPQAVGTPVGDLKAPAPPGEQPKDPAASLQIYQSEAGETATTTAPNFTAPPEQPAPRAAPTTQVAQAPVSLPPAQPASKAAELKPAQPAPKPAAAPPKAEAPAPKPAPKPAAPAPKPVAAAPTPKPAASASGVAGVQIGAFSSKALADTGWNDAARIAPGAIAGKGKTVVPVEVNGSTLYRTTVTGFSSRAEAKAFCDQLKAAGKNCFVK